MADHENDQVNDQVAKLLAALRQRLKTAADLMSEMGLVHRPSVRKRYLRPVIAMDLIKMTGRNHQRLGARGTGLPRKGGEFLGREREDHNRSTKEGPGPNAV